MIGICRYDTNIYNLDVKLFLKLYSLQVSGQYAALPSSGISSHGTSEKLAFAEWLQMSAVSPRDALNDPTESSTVRFQIGSPKFGWSNTLWQVAGIQFASFQKDENQGIEPKPTFLVMIFCRAGTWHVSISCLEDPTAETQQACTPSISLPSQSSKQIRPGFTNIAFAVEELRLHFCDEHDPVRDERGLIIYPEILRISSKAMTVVLSTSADAPESSRNNDRLGYLSYIKAYSTLFVAVEDLEVDHFLQDCNFPVLLSFSRNEISRTKQGLLQLDPMWQHDDLNDLLESLLDKKMPRNRDKCILGRIIYTDTWQRDVIPAYFHSVEIQVAPAVLQVSCAYEYPPNDLELLTLVPCTD